MSDRDKEPPETDGDAAEPIDDLAFPAEILERIPEDERAAFSRKLVSYGLQVTREVRYSSDLPSYEEASGWNALVPGTAERIFNRYEQLEIKKLEANDRVLDIAEEKFRNDSEFARKQQNNLVSVAQTQQKNNADRTSRGQWFAFVAFIFISLGGFYMVHLGHDALGIAVLVFEAVGVAGVFLHQIHRDQLGKRDLSTGRRSVHPDQLDT